MPKSKPKAYKSLLTKQNRLPVWNPSHPNWYTNLLRKSWYPHPNTKTASVIRKLPIYYNGVGIVREPTAEEMEEYFQEHISKKPFLKAKTA